MTRIAGFLGALILSLVPAMARADPPIWTAKSTTASVTLFGSVHLLKEGTSWRSPALDEALKNADEVWFEIPLDPATQASALPEALRLGLLPADQNLESMLPPLALARLHRVEAAEGMSSSKIDKLRPWLAEVFISVAYFEKRGGNSANGVENQINTSLPAAIPRRAFETVQEQFGLFAGAPLKDQAASLGETLREIEEEPDSFDKIVAAWLAGDERGLVREAIDPMKKDAPGAYQTLVVKRNRHFADEITHLLAGHQRILVVVGAGHLVGPDGVPTLLRTRGVKVDRLDAGG